MYIGYSGGKIKRGCNERGETDLRRKGVFRSNQH